MRTDNKKLTAVFFKKASGKEPVKEWIKDLTPANRKIIGRDIKTVELGWPIGMPVCRPLDKGLYEVRSTLECGNIEARVIFCLEGNTMLLLHSFIKKSQKTPQKEIDLAFNRKKEIYR
jgi:phage-related protein